MSDPIVEISDGKLRGYEATTLNNKRYYTFKGIPYAKPPVGELRFSCPVPPEPWTAVRDCTKDCNICIQLDKVTQTIVGDEDCLYLNVYSPALRGEGSGLPVMVYIHGGGFMFGSGTDASVHGPDYLVEQGVVVVSFNYRLGILGFLSLGCKDAPGNMGLRDQVQALKWVKNSISHFGGDPGNVTVFGVSAGGASVEYLLLSPMASGLFHKAIIQSGSSLNHWARNDNMREIIKKLPPIKDNDNIDDTQIIQILKGLSSKDLVAASIAALLADTNWKGGIHYGFVPAVEKPGDWEPFLEKEPYELLSRGEFTHVPILVGFCSREGLLLRHYGPHILEKLKQGKIFLNHLPFEIDDSQKADLESKMKIVYSESDNRYGEHDEYAINFFSDVDFIGGIYVAASLMSKNHSPVYLYEFAYRGKLNYMQAKMGISAPGACHGDDGGYLLRSALLPVSSISETDKLVRDRMVAFFTNFAKYGDPTPTTDSVVSTKWAPLAPARAQCMVVSDRLDMQAFPYAARAQLFAQLFAEKYAPKH